MNPPINQDVEHNERERANINARRTIIANAFSRLDRRNGITQKERRSRADCLWQELSKLSGLDHENSEEYQSLMQRRYGL